MSHIKSYISITFSFQTQMYNLSVMKSTFHRKSLKCHLSVFYEQPPLLHWNSVPIILYIILNMMNIGIWRHHLRQTTRAWTKDGPLTMERPSDWNWVHLWHVNVQNKSPFWVEAIGDTTLTQHHNIHWLKFCLSVSILNHQLTIELFIWLSIKSATIFVVVGACIVQVEWIDFLQLKMAKKEAMARVFFTEAK